MGRADVGVVDVVVTAIGTDRPGIVAAVSGALVAHDANIEDSSMSILRGRFAMVLVVVVPDETSLPELERSLAAATEDLGLLIHVEPLVPGAAEAGADTTGAGGDGSSWTLSVYGADRPGIVHRVTSLLADRGVNITDLSTRVVGADRPVYVMLLDLVVPSDVAEASLREALSAVGAELGIECTLHRADPDVL